MLKENYFLDDGAYQIATDLNDTQGYWVNLSQEATLTLFDEGAAKPLAMAAPVPGDRLHLSPWCWLWAN